MNSTSPAKKLAVLDLKRATGIGIRMARLPAPWANIREAIMTCDEEVLKTSEDVETVLGCLPTDEEWRMLQVRTPFARKKDTDRQNKMEEM